jgi:hypothetical protein
MVEPGNITTRVGKRDLVDLVRVEPDLSFSAF